MAVKGIEQGWTCLAAGLQEAPVQEQPVVPGRPPSAKVWRRMPLALRAPGLAFLGGGGGGGGGRLQELDLKLCLARGCGSRPGAVAPAALGDREAGRGHLSAPLGLGMLTSPAPAAGGA